MGERLDAAAAELNDAIRELRELARGIHPAILEEEGLGAAVGGLAAEPACRSRSTRRWTAGCHRWSSRPPTSRSPRRSPTRSATPNATPAAIHMAHTDGHLDVRITDDGAGGADPARGTGLSGLADRVSALGGEFEVTSTSAGGTTVHASIPVT